MSDPERKCRRCGETGLTYLHYVDSDGVPWARIPGPWSREDVPPFCPECEAPTYTVAGEHKRLPVKERCSPGCPGWFPSESDRGYGIERCDSCARFDDDEDAVDYVHRMALWAEYLMGYIGENEWWDAQRVLRVTGDTQ